MKKVALQPVDETALVTTGAPLLSALLARDLRVQMSCGGKGICSTCHVHVREGMDDLSPVEPRERRTLSLVADCRPNSRLACQARVYGDGIVAEVPDGMYIERAEDLLGMLGERAPQNILHPITGAVLIPKGKIITRTLLEQSRGLEQEVEQMKAAAGNSGTVLPPLTAASGRFTASSTGWRPPGTVTVYNGGRASRPPQSTPPGGTSPPEVRTPPPAAGTAEAARLDTAPLIPPLTDDLSGERPPPSTLPVTVPPAAPKVRATDLQPGSQIDKYLLMECVGKGGAGLVYRALHTKLKTPVAVKFLRPDVLNGDNGAIGRFTREAQLLARLVHPNVVRVLDFEDDPAQPYVVMEFVDGASAADLLTQSGRVAPDRAVRIVRDVTDGLAAAHRLGIVHRDVKPGNILVTRAGTSKLVDLGLATVVRTGAGDGPGTTGGAFEGTVAYMSPEQARGDADIDHRSDIYSLGVTFYHLVTGQLPFNGRSATEVIMKHLHRPPPPPHEVAPGLSQALSRVIGVMLAKDREDRYATCADVRRELAALPEAAPRRVTA